MLCGLTSVAEQWGKYFRPDLIVSHQGDLIILINKHLAERLA